MNILIVLVMLVHFVRFCKVMIAFLAMTANTFCVCGFIGRSSGYLAKCDLHFFDSSFRFSLVSRIDTLAPDNAKKSFR
ncbi:MAG: hypothetical protein C5B59_12375 [Bacteroidetes bacterium]|nr:MAG: hypothetical protein C5B59_12375 [Bacteroidota bacterium]